MIGFLRGKIARKTLGEAILDVNGVGYLLNLSRRAEEACGGEGSNAEFIIYTDVRENAIVLFGFENQLEREVFLLLKKVNGIGSKVAMSVLSGMGAAGLLQAIGQQDMTGLTKVPGVGKKTAERMIVELREYVSELLGTEVKPLARSVERVPNEVIEPAGPETDARLALEKLGFSAERAREAVKLAVANTERLDAGEILRRALAHVA